MKNKFTLIQFFAITGNVILPLYSFVLYLFCLRTITGFSFFIFVSVCIVERAWETFRTTKERKREEMHGDWTLAAVTFVYLMLFFGFLTEFYLLVKLVNLKISLIGLILLVISLRFRWWGMSALGSQWAVHAVGAQKIKRVRLLRIGPYKYIRHPIYTGIILELLSFPVIANAPISFFFALFICVPLVIVRAYFEEQASMRRFGDKFLEYKKNVGMFLPTQFLGRQQ